MYYSVSFYAIAAYFHIFRVIQQSALIAFFPAYIGILTAILISHARTVVRECCKGDDESQWERGKFDPPPPKIKPLNRWSPKFV